MSKVDGQALGLHLLLLHLQHLLGAGVDDVDQVHGLQGLCSLLGLGVEVDGQDRGVPGLDGGCHVPAAPRDEGGVRAVVLLESLVVLSLCQWGRETELTTRATVSRVLTAGTAWTFRQPVA